MEGVIQALKRAREHGQPVPMPPASSNVGHETVIELPPTTTGLFSPGPANRLPTHGLRDQRIVAFDQRDPHARSFDLLRNRVIANTQADESRVVAVASPTRGSGASTTAFNLALSIARQRNWNVALIDLDGRSTSFETFGLAGPYIRTTEFDGVALARIEVENCSLLAGSFPVGSAFRNPRASRDLVVSEWLQRAKRAFGPTIFILDLPPLLGSDDGLPLVMRADFLVLVLGVGIETVADFEACRSSIATVPHLVTLNRTRRHGL